MFLWVIFFVNLTQASTLIVSDIDDTIKQSFVLSRLGSVENAKRLHNDFFAMSEFYTYLASARTDSEFVYLSSAPTILMQTMHEQFLKKNSFPNGRLITRMKYSEDQHKIQNLRMLLKNKIYDLVILFGDNGQKDSMIYQKIANEFPQVEIQTYIRMVYSQADLKYPGAAIQPGQMGFVTPIDILRDLAHKNKIDFSQALNWASALIPLLMEKSLDEDATSVTFPKWQNCSDYQNFIINFPALEIDRFNAFVNNRCH